MKPNCEEKLNRPLEGFTPLAINMRTPTYKDIQD